MEIPILKDILESNQQGASEIRNLLKKKKIYMIDMISSPGSGKTTLNDSLILRLKKKYKIAVIEGDIKTTKDSEKLAKHGIQIIQIETDRFRRDCHLESSWIKQCLDSFNLDNLDFIIIENIGNLICPAEFDLGHDDRFVLLSTTEGEDKPAKYPTAFTSSQIIVMTKTDLLPHLDYNMAEVENSIAELTPQSIFFKVSAKTGEGIDTLVSFIEKKISAKKKI